VPCESALVTSPPHVDHYAPKSEVRELIVMGHESSGKTNVTGRKTSIIPSRGYGWLAYYWNNYLLACERCNTPWKRAIFPVFESPRCAISQSLDEVYKLGWPWMGESPLLLNPYNTPYELPAHQFEFGPLKEIKGLTKVAKTTIDICGLDRPSLREQRRPKYEQTDRQIRRYLTTPNLSRSELRFLLEELHEQGKPNIPYAAVTRWLVDRHLDMRWDEFELVIQRLKD
jgi:hypothetical protein